MNGRAVPGARGRAGRSHTQRSVAGPLEFNILKTHPVPRQRILALVKAFFGAKEKRISLGVYPDVSLKMARDKRDEARRLIIENIDPSEHRKLLKKKNGMSTEKLTIKLLNLNY